MGVVVQRKIKKGKKVEDPVMMATSERRRIKTWILCLVGLIQLYPGIYIPACTNYVTEEGPYDILDYDSRRICNDIEEPENGKIVGTGKPIYVVGSRINFTCDSGYELEGSPSVVCCVDGNWRPRSPPTCKPVYYSNNAKISGESLDGTAKNNGSQDNWKSPCGIHPATKTKCIEDISLSQDGTVLTILCKETSGNQSVTEIGSLTAICHDEKWDEIDNGCFCDCKVNTNGQGLNIDTLQEKFLKHGQVLNWSCSFGFEKSNMSDIICEDGEISQPTCVMNWRDWLILILTLIVTAIFMFAFMIYHVQKCKSGKNSDKDRSPEVVCLADRLNLH